MATLKNAASLMGRRSAQVRLQKWGKEEFARRMREWGKLGGRPPGSGGIRITIRVNKKTGKRVSSDGGQK